MSRVVTNLNVGNGSSRNVEASYSLLLITTHARSITIIDISIGRFYGVSGSSLVQLGFGLVALGVSTVLSFSEPFVSGYHGLLKEDSE